MIELHLSAPEHFPLTVHALPLGYVCHGCGEERGAGALCALVEDPTGRAAGQFTFCMGCCQEEATRAVAEYEAAVGVLREGRPL